MNTWRRWTALAEARAERDSLEHSVRIKTHVLSVRIIANVVVPSTIQDCVDGRAELGMRDGGAASHRLEISQKRS